MELLNEVMEVNVEFSNMVENTAEEEEQTQRQLNDDEKSDHDSLWGDDSDDELILVQKPSLNEIYQSDEDKIEIEDSEMRNLLASPASTKEIMDNSPFSIISKPIDYDSNDDDSTKFSVKAKKVTKKIKQEIKKEFTKQSVVQSEVEAVKLIQAGPSESELRRRQLIEIDQDELDERVDRLQKATLRSITSCTGLTKAEQKRQLQECRQFLATHLRMAEYEKVVEDGIAKQNKQSYPDSEVSVNCLQYLHCEEDQYSSDEGENEGEQSSDKDSADKAVEQAVRDPSAGMIVLSDSDEDEEEEVVKAQPVPVVLTETDIRREAYLAKMSRPKSARAALLISLRQKVLQTAGDNYCADKKINNGQLAVRMEIAEKTRMLVELLKERHETRSLTDREARRLRYQTQASAEDEEFDSDDEGQLGDGLFLSDADRAALMRQMSGQDDEEDEEENNDDWQPEEEQEGDEEDNQQQEDGDSEGRVEEAMKEEELSVMQEEEDEGVQMRGRSGGAGRNVVMDEEGEDLEVAVPSRPLVQYGRARAVPAADGEEQQEHSIEVTGEGDGGEARETLMDEEGEEEIASETVVEARRVKAPKGTGNNMFRLQLEQEDRKARSAKKSGLLDEEAEESDEEEGQRGLGDFGFGTMSELREMDEEKDALKLRRGDLDHIVDDVSDGEGDEEAAAKARVEMEIAEDKQRTKDVIFNVTEGRDAAKRRAQQGSFAFGNLVKDRRSAREDEKDEVKKPGEEDEDEEEMLQRGMLNVMDRERYYKKHRHTGEASDSDSEGEEEDDEEGEDRYAIIGAEHMTEQERLAEEARLQLQREQDRVDASRCKLIERQTKMRREMRRQQACGGQLLPVASFDSQGPLEAPLLARTLSLDPVSSVSVAAVSGDPVKRRTSLAPRKAPLHSARPSAVQRTSTHSSGGQSSSDQGKNALARRSTVNPSSSSLHYNGQLNQSERVLGMGMAVTSAPVRIASSDSQTGLFSAVTSGLKRGASEALHSGSLLGGGPKRSFCSSIKRSSTLSSGSSSSNLSVVQQTAFVFTSESSSHGVMGTSEHSNMYSSHSYTGGGDNHSRGAFSTRETSSLGRSATTQSALPISGNSLFAKLAGGGVLKTSKSGGR